MTFDRRMIGPIVSGILAGVAALASSWLLRHVELATGARAIIALLPVPFFVWFVLMELQWVRTLDEFHRRVVLDSLAIAFPLAITMGVAIDGLQKGGFVATWSVGDLWPYMALVWIPSIWIANRRYPRDHADE